MLTWSKRTSIAAMALLAGLGSGPARAADIDVILALPTNTLTFTSAFIAEDGGFYKKHGLNVTTRYLAGVSSNNAVINGSADFLLGSIATMLNGVARGQPMLMIANMVDRPMVEIVIRKDIADAAGVTANSPLITPLNSRTAVPHGVPTQ